MDEKGDTHATNAKRQARTTWIGMPRNLSLREFIPSFREKHILTSLPSCQSLTIKVTVCNSKRAPIPDLTKDWSALAGTCTRTTEDGGGEGARDPLGRAEPDVQRREPVPAPAPRPPHLPADADTCSQWLPRNCSARPAPCTSICRACGAHCTGFLCMVASAHAHDQRADQPREKVVQVVLGVALSAAGFPRP